VARGVHQVQDISLTILRLVVQADSLGLDGDAALALDVHIVEDLLGHLALGQAAGFLDQTIGQGRLAMVDVGDDGEVADVGQGRGHAEGRLAQNAGFARVLRRLQQVPGEKRG